MKKEISVLLVLTLLSAFVFSFNMQQIEAKTVKYSYIKVDKTKSYKGGIGHNYYKYPKLKGSSKGVKKINKILRKKANAFVNTKYVDEYFEPGITHFSQDGSYVEYYNTADGKATYNDGQVIGMKFRTYWFAGGVATIDFYGYTFDVQSGRKLTLSDVVPNAFNPKTKKGYLKLRQFIYNELLKKQDNDYVASNFLEKYNTKKKLNKAEFFINKIGKVTVCFQTYDIGGGVDSCIMVTIPSRYL